MKESDNKNWLRALTLCGVLYLLIGIISGELGWRLAAWLISALVFGTHVAYGHFGLRNTPRQTALHASAGAAFGAFALAVAANVHELWANPGHHRSLLLLALVLWPLLTVVPAFVVALAAAVGLARWRPGISKSDM